MTEGLGAAKEPIVAEDPIKIDGKKDLGMGVPGAASAAGVGKGIPGAASAASIPGGEPSKAADERNREFLRAENEDDDGYDPYSDRRPDPEPLFERDPWS